MSRANVEIAKGVVDAFNRHDVEGFFALAASDFEWFPAMAGTVEGGGYRGREDRQGAAGFAGSAPGFLSSARKR